MKFSEVQKQHENLLEKQWKGGLSTTEVLKYMDNARFSAGDYSFEERQMVQANLRYWAAYIFDETRDYAKTELSTINPPSKIRSTLKNIGSVLLSIFLVTMFILGLGQVPKILTIVQNPGTAPAPPQIVIYDNGGVFFVVAFGFFAAIIIALQIIIFRRQTAMFLAGVGRRVTEVFQNVRKSMVGGPRNRPLASLRIIDGPHAMIGQELKIYTEVVKLGRDPKRAEIIFYEPDTDSSVSGLHARIELVNHAWRIIAVSISGSETFVNDIAIPFAEPYKLESGQLVRLGYAEQKPVTFEFNVLATTFSIREFETDYRKTDVGVNTMPVNFSKASEKTKASGKKLQTQGSDDDIFSEYRDRDQPRDIYEEKSQALGQDDDFFDDFRER